MAAQRQIPGGPFLNETGTRQAQIPGGPCINETQSAGGGAIPTMSSPGVTNILTTSATPQITLTF